MTEGSTPTAAGLLLVLAVACPAAAQDKARPPVRFDNWLYYQHNFDGTDRWQYRPRFYIPFNLSDGWTFTQRIDLPNYLTDKPGPENPDGEWKAGIADWFVEETLQSPEVAKNLRWSTSVRLVFPTGGQQPFGASQYQWAPSLGVQYTIPERNLAFSPLARYFMSFYADLPGAAKIRKLSLFPTVTFGSLFDGWSLALWSENDVTYNDLTDKWFVPVDLLATKALGKTTEIGFGGAWAVVKDDPAYKYVINARLTFRF